MSLSGIGEAVGFSLLVRGNVIHLGDSLHSTPTKMKTNPDLLLPAGKTCGDCHWFFRCQWLILVPAKNSWCDFFPIRFREKLQNPEIKKK